MVPAGAGGLGLARLQVFFRLGGETLAAARAAEEIILALVGEAMLGGRADRPSCRRPDRSPARVGLVARAMMPPQQACVRADAVMMAW